MPPAPPSPRQRIGQEEINRIAAEAGYPNDVPNFLLAVEDMALGLKDCAHDRTAGTIDNWGFCAHYKNFAVTFRTMMRGCA